MITVIPEHEDRIGKQIVDSAYAVHMNLGPGLLESVYEECFCHELRKRRLSLERQTRLPLVYEGVQLGLVLELDVLVEGLVICELKARPHHPIDIAQTLSHLKLAGKHLGYLINFHVPVIKSGIKRLIV